MGELQLYQSHKLTHAEPMTYVLYLLFQTDNPKLRSSDIDAQKGVSEGYHIVYDLGSDSEYHSWCPKDKFESGNKLFDDETTGLTFGLATHAAKYLGKKIARKGWNGKEMFAFIVPANKYPAQTDIIKGVFVDDMVPYRAYWALKTAQNDIAMYSPNGSDTMAEDWEIVL